MNFVNFLLILGTAVVFVHSAVPVFLDDGGSKICTLNNVGTIPAGSVKYPVYQKVCRHVVPTLGDPIEDETDDKMRKSNKKASVSDDAVETIRRAILSTK